MATTPAPPDDPDREPRRAADEAALPAAAQRRRGPGARRLIAALLALVVVAAGGAAVLLGGGGDTAATVNGEEIEAATVEEATAGDTSGDDEASLAARRQVVGLLVADRIITDVAQQQDVEVTDADRRQAREQLLAGLGGQEALGPALQQAGLTPELFEDVVVPQQARVLALGRSLAEGRSLETRTVRHVMVPDEEAAEQVREQIAGGADFAEVAAERSQDQASAAAGGELPPAGRGALPQPLDDAVWEAEPGTLQGPLQTPSGWHVFEVVAEDTTPAAELEPSQVAQLTGEEVTELLRSAVAEAEVEVSDELGRWDPQRMAVVPAEGAQPQPGGPQPGGPQQGEPDQQPVEPQQPPTEPSG